MTDSAPPTFTIRAADGEKPITLAAGVPTFLLGANGTGKSALVHDIVVQTQGAAEYIPGSRPSYFASEALSMTPASRQTMRQNLPVWDRNPMMRWNPIQASERNEKAIHDIQAAEIQFKVDAADQIAREGKESDAVSILQSGGSPIDRVNRLLALATLPIRTALVGAELKMKRGTSLYSLARASDGERSALIIISTILPAAAGTLFIIDEPELHLHRSIVVPLLIGLVRERPDCFFLISTHELELPSAIENASSIAVRGCEWANDTVQSWDVDFLPPASDIPEDVRTDVLGSRRKILFVEGQQASLDQPMYALLFPSVSVRHRTGCKEVRQAVSGLRAILSSHTVEPFGLVDNDRMSASEIIDLEAENIFALGVFTVESLYYSRDVRDALAERQADTLGLDVPTLSADALAKGLAEFGKPITINHLAARLCERALREQVLGAIPSRAALVANTMPTVSLTFPSPFPSEHATLSALVTAGDLDSIIDRYPVRESGALDAIAKALRFSSRADYERAVLARVALDPALADRLRARLGPLSSVLPA